MRQFLTFVLSILLSIAAFAQTSTVAVEEASKADVAKEAKKILKKYGTYEFAVNTMDRDEWLVFSQWEGYDEDRVIQIIQERKAEYQAVREQRKQARMAAASECDCWVEPDDTYTQVTTNDWVESGGAGPDVDSFLGPIALNGWSFNLYGELFNSFYINSKGTVSFGNGYIDWTPEEFPDATYDQIAGYWADFDFRATGELWYKVTPEAVFVNFIDVGYFNNHADKRNTFQIVFTPEDSEYLADENNVQLCYLEMQWAHGDVGGSGGCCGPNPGNVGADRASSTGANIQYGRFNSLDFEYNGPYGDDDANQDGVYWLNNKQFNFSTVGFQQNNVPPLSTADFGCDTITLCQNDTLELDLQFLAPETDQTVTIDFSVDGFEDGLYVTNIIENSSATFLGGYVGGPDNLGLNTITITATDDGVPAASTSVDIVVEVIDVELPVLTVEGEPSICAGASTLFTASPGFDSYIWSTGCSGPTCEISQGGQVLVEASIEEGCSAQEIITVEQTPFILPPINIDPNPICSDGTATVTVLEDYVDYEWEADYNGGGGEILENNGQSIVAETGTYRLEVEQENGCFGQRIFIIDSFDAFIPEDTWSGAYCDGLEPVVFDGGFSSPDEGAFNIWLESSNPEGWGGSFINVYIDGELSNTLTLTTTFAIESVPIEAGETITVEYISSGSGDEFNDLQFFNCSSQNSVDPEPPFTNGEIVFDAPAGCSADPAFGSWSIISGPAGATFSNLDQFDTEFTPGDYGLYEICFTEETCEIEYCYTLEYTEAPAIALNESDVLLCGDESVTVTATVEDIGGTATIDWPTPGEDDVLSNSYSFSEPTEINDEVVITNGCGSASAPLEITAQFEPQAPVIEDEILCDGGTVTLDPIDNDTDDLIYTWTFDGAVLGEDGDELEASETGTYCINISNECFPEGVEDCAQLSIAGNINPFGDAWADCDGDGVAIVEAAVPGNGWTIIWPDGSEGTTYETSTQGEVCAEITDPGNCATETYCTNVFIGEAPVVNPSPNELITLCPEIENTFSLGATDGIAYTWSINCAGETIVLDGDDDLNLASSQLSQDCWGQVLTLNADVANPCGSASASFEVTIDPCAITIPNIFTPDGNPPNESFSIEGLDVYSDVQLYVYNRWGNLVYESQDYQNGDWKGEDAADGTYWYVLLLPNGIEEKGSVTISRLQ